MTQSQIVELVTQIRKDHAEYMTRQCKEIQDVIDETKELLAKSKKS